MRQVFECPASEALLIKLAPGEGSENPDCRRDHLIHRKRSPFPYEGKALTPVNVGVTCNVGRDTARHYFARRKVEVLRSIRKASPPFESTFLSFPLRGRGTAPRWMK